MIRAAKNLARPHVFTRWEDFDADPDMINVGNGILNLNTFTLTPHDPDRLLTHFSSVPYDPSATAPFFEESLARAIPDPEMRRFLLRLFGYGLTGHVGEQVFVLHHGKGGNLKSTIINAVRRTMGTYGQTAKPATFALGKREGGAPSGDRARLAGARLVTVSEIAKPLKIDTGFVKEATGGEELTARHLYQKEFNFDPQFLLMVTSDDLPAIDDPTDAMWRRVLLVPWTVQVPRHKQLPEHQVRKRLAAEAPGIPDLGCRRCQGMANLRLGRASSGFGRDQCLPGPTRHPGQLPGRHGLRDLPR